MTTLFGIKNCDTVKKARKWLDSHDVAYTFHDFRADGLDAPLIQQWLQQVQWEVLLNKRSTTWRQLDEQTKNALSADSVIDLFCQHPTLIKRPVLQHSNQVNVGFKADEYAKIFP